MCVILSFLLVVFVAVGPAWGQAQAPPSQRAGPSQGAQLTDELIDQLIAAIALYPDALLSQVLVAATSSRRCPGRQAEVLEDSPPQSLSSMTATRRMGPAHREQVRTSSPQVLLIRTAQASRRSRAGSSGPGIALLNGLGLGGT